MAYRYQETNVARVHMEWSGSNINSKLKTIALLNEEYAAIGFGKEAKQTLSPFHNDHQKSYHHHTMSSYLASPTMKRQWSLFERFKISDGMIIQLCTKLSFSI